MRAIFVDPILRGEWVTICAVRLNANRGVEHVSGWERNGSTWDLAACCAEVATFDIEDPATRGAMMDQVEERVGQINTCRVDSEQWGICVSIHASSGVVVASGYHKTYGRAVVELMRVIAANAGVSWASGNANHASPRVAPAAPFSGTPSSPTSQSWHSPVSLFLEGTSARIPGTPPSRIPGTPPISPISPRNPGTPLSLSS
jgi:hypothetical protein